MICVQRNKIIVAMIVAISLIIGISWRNSYISEKMNPGLAIRQLQKEGINGSGVNIAIIDQKLLTTHREYAQRLVHYEEVGDLNDEPVSMHGSAVSSILVGKKCGIASGANLYYWAVAIRGNGTIGERYAQAIYRVIEFNRTLPQESRIRIISISTGFDAEEGRAAFEAAINQAQLDGIMVFTSTFPYYTTPVIAVYGAALQMGGVRDNINDYNVPPAVVTGWGQTAEVVVNERQQRGQQQCYATIWVPIEPRLLASWRGNHRYEFYEEGGDSWATPYVAGVAALVLHVNPALSNKQVIEIIAQTTVQNAHGLLMISPTNAIAHSGKQSGDEQSQLR